MKKIITIAVLLLMITGCDNVIICKTKGGNIKEEYSIKYSGNDITKITTKKIYRFDNKEEFKNFESIVQYSVKANISNNVTAKYKKKNKKYILIQEYNIKNMSEEELTKYSINKNKEEYINKLKLDGLICK